MAYDFFGTSTNNFTSKIAKEKVSIDSQTILWWLNPWVVKTSALRFSISNHISLVPINLMMSIENLQAIDALATWLLFKELIHVEQIITFTDNLCGVDWKVIQYGEQW